jgi:hypothetical protein
MRFTRTNLNGPGGTNNGPKVVVNDQASVLACFQNKVSRGRSWIAVASVARCRFGMGWWLGFAAPKCAVVAALCQRIAKPAGQATQLFQRLPDFETLSKPGGKALPARSAGWQFRLQAVMRRNRLKAELRTCNAQTNGSGGNLRPRTGSLLVLSQFSSTAA